MIVDGLYTAVNHKVTVVNGPYFAHFISTVLWPPFDVSYTPKTVTNGLKIEYLIVNTTVKYGHNIVATERVEYSQKKSSTVECMLEPLRTGDLFLDHQFFRKEKNVYFTLNY